MKYVFRRHPIAVTVIALFFSPYLLALALVLGIVFVLALVFDALLMDQ